MVKDAIAGERLITFTLLKSDAGGSSSQTPPFEQIGTLGYINRVQEIEGGRQHILVTGLTKVDIAELDSSHSYRRGAVTPIRDFTALNHGDKRRKELLSLFNAILEKTSTEHSIEVLASENIPLEMVAHIIVSALPIEAGEKQKMLELQSLELRLDILKNFLESGLSSIDSMPLFKPMLPISPFMN